MTRLRFVLGSAALTVLLAMPAAVFGVMDCGHCVECRCTPDGPRAFVDCQNNICQYATDDDCTECDT